MSHPYTPLQPPSGLPHPLPLENDAHRQLAESLQRDGWAQQAHFLPGRLTGALSDECAALAASAGLRAAGIGSGNAPLLRPSIRGDRIAWLQDGRSPACDSYLATMGELRHVLNHNLYLGLEEYESHFAFYAPGAAYLPHRDRFCDDDKRTVSAVLYLNRDWLPGQGGALRLHHDDGARSEIAPQGGQLVLFMSAEMLHEVLPATRERY